MEADVEMRCSFSCFSNVKCDTSIFYPAENAVILKKECIKDIRNHLISNKLGKFTNFNEGHLICFRAGIFSVMGEYLGCPNHRYSLGMKWRRSSILCGHPDHKGKSKPESDRAVTPQISHHLLRTRGVVLPIGSGNHLKFKDN